MCGSNCKSEENAIIGSEIYRRLRHALQYSLNQCPFDGLYQSSPAENISHMAQVHDFFLPRPSRLVDGQGLLTYIGQKVSVGYICLTCDKGFGGIEAVHEHMQVESHRNIPTETARFREEYGAFYDLGDEGEEMDVNKMQVATEIGFEESGYESSSPTAGKKEGLRGLQLTPSIRKKVRHGREKLSERRKKGAGKKLVAVGKSPMARKAAMVMIGGPGWRLCKGRLWRLR